jgi:hypothetical protein
VPDLAGSAVLAYQLQRGLEIQPRSEDPADHDIVDALGNPIAILRQAQGHLCQIACLPGRGIVGRLDARLIRLRYRLVVVGGGC